ncbi:hypothetical protein BGZ90_010199 [Linnemannia elongata]|nr:hypothetical protein BGZ90_010199 [Linnemannia elongata]
MQNNQITIADRALNESIIFLAKYQNSFWSYARGEGTAILLVSGTILFFIAGTASTADSHPYKPAYQFKKTNAMRIVSQTVSTVLPAGQNDTPISIHILPPQPAHIATHG